MLAFALLTAAVAIVAPPALDSPVYSLVTRGPDGRANMNIVTYFTPVAHAPERWYAASLYHGTESRENFLAGNGGVVQILSDAQADVGLLELLGKQSARDVAMPTPLWHEVLELCGGECRELSRLVDRENQGDGGRRGRGNNAEDTPGR